MAKSNCLIIGGTGTLGKALVKRLLNEDCIDQIGVYSRDELKQSEMAYELKCHSDRIRYLIGDVRDRLRLEECCRDYDIVVHAAALKQISACESNVEEAVKTNVGGTSNVVKATLATSVSKLVIVSTDKAVAPINLYGATKMIAEKTALQAAAQGFSTSISVVRYGNVAGSRGSVIPYFAKLKRSGCLSYPITDVRMTRFWTEIDDALGAISFTLSNDLNGCVIVPKSPSFRIVDLARAFDPSANLEEVGIRPGEKLEEALIAPMQMPYLSETKDFFFQSALHTPFFGEVREVDTSYTSGNNTSWLTVPEIERRLQSGGWLCDG